MTMTAAETEYTGGQYVAVEQLKAAMIQLAECIQACDQEGLAPADAFRAAGIEVPGFAAPMLNSLLRHAGSPVDAG
jgi:hypothetical protein